MEKYFLAIVPEGDIQQKALSLKEEICDKHGVKYALKSPAHVTLKMPFVFNEAKEPELISKIGDFLKGYPIFDIRIDGVRTFGNRVIFWDVKADASLFKLQSELNLFCKRELKLVDELADRNYTPHMTIAFKDLKPVKFDPVFELIRENAIFQNYSVSDISVLKKVDGRWKELERISLAEI
ncbi:2'-5' RNA ligase family protein [Algoriphagus namhaensis]|uniref:2'-5' RNA ligase family protein n=1 Tax=Algoriphagus namhaensis TaxID=915353 RepID=A0ABV8AQZ7_9BACT